MEISALYEIYKKYPVVTTDSRVCPHDSIFFALKGEHFNGNQFAESAIEKGCAYAVVDEWENDKPTVVALREIAAGLMSYEFIANAEIVEDEPLFAAFEDESNEAN